MLVLEKGRYRARIAETPDDVAAAQTLRHDCFGLNHAHGLDQDAYDDLCEHMLVEDLETCLLYTSPSPRDLSTSRMPSSA